MPSLSSFLPTVNPANAPLDQEGRDALVAGGGIDRREHDEQVGLVAVRDPELAAGQRRIRPRRAARAWRARRRRCPTLPPTAHRRRPSSTRAAADSAASASSLPQRASALMTSVFCTSTSTATEGSTRESASTASTAWKNVAPAPPYASGISMPITPRSNSLSIERARERRLLVHLADERRDLGARELEHAVAEQLLVLSRAVRAGSAGRSAGLVTGTPRLSCERRRAGGRRRGRARAERSSKSSECYHQAEGRPAGGCAASAGR